MTHAGSTTELGLAPPGAAGVGAAATAAPAPLPVPAPPPGVQRLVARIPRGEPLPVDLWRRRHLLPTLLLGLFAVGIPVSGLWYGHPASAAVRGAAAAILGLVTWRLSKPRWAAEAFAAFSLYLASSMLSQQMGGVLEARVTFFLAALIAIAAYEGWVPLVVALLYVPLDSGARVAFDFPEVSDQHRWALVEFFIVAFALPAWWVIEDGRAKAQKAVARISRLQASILESAGDGIFGIGEDGRTTFVNPAAASLLGWDVDGLVGEVHHEAIPHGPPGTSRCRGDDCALTHAIQAGRSAAVVGEVFVARDGSEIPVEYSVVPFDAPGGAAAAVVTFRDVSARIEAEAREREINRLHEADLIHRRLLEQMHDALLPPLPVVDRMDIGVAYLSADPSAPTGGDLYDVQMVGPSELLVTVVDALGKGVGATKHALAVVHLVRSLVLEGHELALAINKAAGIIEEHSPELVATVAAARINARSGEVRLVSGGHPPALVVREGSATYLEAVGGPLGWPGAGADDAVETLLGEGDAVVFFTDGLVEAGGNIVEGLDQLATESQSLWGASAQVMADELMERLAASPERRDDTLVLVVRRRPTP